MGLYDDVTIVSGGGYELTAAVTAAANAAADKREREWLPPSRGDGYWIARYDSRGVDCGDTWVRVCLTQPPRERIQKREEPYCYSKSVAEVREDFQNYLDQYDANLAAYWAEIEAGRQ